MSYRIAVDVGGTFTDVVAVDEAGRTTFAKAPSTPENQAIGTMDGIERLATRLGLSVADLLGQTERIVHGMTVATNALLERKGAKVGLLTTAGHRDVLEMREGLKPERYNMRLPRQEPLVPRRLRFGVKERLRADGRVDEPLDRDSVMAAIERLKAEDVGSVAVCYLHAYRDPRHEVETRDILEHEMPGVSVSLSSDVLPQIKEYERVSTTVVNAYVAPLIAQYLGRLEQRLSEAGFGGPLLIILSHGGVAPVSEAVRVAAATVLSGPAGGLAGGRRVAEIMASPNLITFDVGGTSSDIALIADGEATLSKDRTMAGERIALPSLDIVTLGAGGGSLARVEASGLLEVGPQSAGSVPGPICYGRGGTRPTVTDASVVLAFLILTTSPVAQPGSIIPARSPRSKRLAPASAFPRSRLQPASTAWSTPS
jgi:N-methylhydantoinase A